MLKKIVCWVCVCVMPTTLFVSVISHEVFADGNNQRWIYVTLSHVCPNGVILYETTSRTLDTWSDENHPLQTPRWEQVCYPLWGGGVHCEDDWVYYHTPHSVTWHNAEYHSWTREIDSPACR